MHPFLQLLISISTLVLGASTIAGNKNAKIKTPLLVPVKYPVNKTPEFNPPVMQFSRDPVVTSDSASCVIPFSRAGNLIIIKAKVDSTEGNFVLDTGAPYLILNMTYFRDYPASAESQDNPGGITGNVTNTVPTNVSNLSFGPLKYFNLEADRINLGHIENSKGIKILGLLGLQLFKQFEMIIDYGQSVIHLHLIGRKEKSISFHNPLLKDTASYSTIPIKIKENKLLIFGNMAGKKLTFVVDTGAESNIMDSRLPNKILENISITSRVILTGTGNDKIEALYGTMKNMKIGHQDIILLPVLVTNLEKMCDSYNECIDGMLGFDFLSLQKIGFNFVKHKMYIWK